MGMQSVCLPNWILGVLVVTAVGRVATRGLMSLLRERSGGRTREAGREAGDSGQSETNEFERERP